MTDRENESLVRIARQRVGFKLHILIALGGNLLMWMIYYVTWTGYPWPAWFLVGSAISVAIHWMVIYSSLLSVDKEYKKLKK